MQKRTVLTLQALVLTLGGGGGNAPPWTCGFLYDLQLQHCLNFPFQHLFHHNGGGPKWHPHHYFQGCMYVIGHTEKMSGNSATTCWICRVCHLEMGSPACQWFSSSILRYSPSSSQSSLAPYCATSSQEFQAFNKLTWNKRAPL